MDLTLPAKCFISHAYEDAALRDQLISKLAPPLHAVVFPPITVGPYEFVSNPLIEAILDCDGLIYLRGGKSDQSFWVAFERDYALRGGKQVFAAELAPLQLVQDTGPPLDLAAFASYHRNDAPRVREIADFLTRERHFDLWFDGTGFGIEGLEKELTESLGNRLKRGGYAILFWSRKASESLWVRKELELAAKDISDFNDRVLFALLEDCPLPEFWTRFQEPSVQLYGDAARPMAHRLDDLTVRLYWLIYRNQGRTSTMLP